MATWTPNLTIRGGLDVAVRTKQTTQTANAAILDPGHFYRSAFTGLFYLTSSSSLQNPGALRARGPSHHQFYGKR